jgi:hypothetical protein
MARLRGQVEVAEAIGLGAPSPSPLDKVAATVNAMRESGAPEADIVAFLKVHAA